MRRRGGALRPRERFHSHTPPLRRWVRVFLEYSSSVTPPLTSGEEPRAGRAPAFAADFAGGLKSSLSSLWRFLLVNRSQGNAAGRHSGDVSANL